MAGQSPCIFCKIVAHRFPATIVYEDSDHLAFFPREHLNPGHLLLIPKHHIDYLFDMSAHSYLALWATVAKLAPGLQSVTSAKRVGVAVEGFAVPHVHVHMVPLYAREELNPARAKPISPGDAEGLARGLREAFGA